jgi:hypothetical protein
VTIFLIFIISIEQQTKMPSSSKSRISIACIVNYWRVDLGAKSRMSKELSTNISDSDSSLILDTRSAYQSVETSKELIALAKEFGISLIFNRFIIESC